MAEDIAGFHGPVRALPVDEVMRLWRAAKDK